MSWYELLGWSIFILFIIPFGLLLWGFTISILSSEFSVLLLPLKNLYRDITGGKY